MILKFIELSGIITKSQCRLKFTQNSCCPFTLSGSKNSGKLLCHAIPEKGGGETWRLVGFHNCMTDPLIVSWICLWIFPLIIPKTVVWCIFVVVFIMMCPSIKSITICFFKSHHYASKLWSKQKNQVYVQVCCTAFQKELIFALQKKIKTLIRLLSKQKCSAVENESEFKPLQYFECTQF